MAESTRKIKKIKSGEWMIILVLWRAWYRQSVTRGTLRSKWC